MHRARSCGWVTEIRTHAALGRRYGGAVAMNVVRSSPSLGNRVQFPAPLERRARLLLRQRCRKISEFGFHLCRIRHRFRDFLADKVPVALAEPVNRDLERAFGSAYVARDGIGRRCPIEKEALQSVEMVPPSVLHELGAESIHHSIEHRLRPAPIEDLLRRFIVRRLALVTRFADENSRESTAPPPRFCARPRSFSSARKRAGREVPAEGTQEETRDDRRRQPCEVAQACR